ncbi:hypothetical protein [Candidatus Spongiihabitans sp.]|uniref:hypothetical protein n=1 Tax=Candidatus Spongiihabitans sp. TaxID=3101308 RepID=UPI003C6EBE51
MGHAVGIEALLEASYELRAVIGADEARRFWQPLAQRVKGDSEAGVRVDESEQVRRRPSRRPSRRRTTVSQANTSSG